MAHCVNRSSIEFKVLAEQTSINPIILAAKISLWQEVNGIENFPSINNLFLQTEGNISSIASKETLKLIENAAFKMGISIQKLADYLKGNPEIESKGINGLADLVKGTVAIAQGMEEVSLTEEIVHVATAILEQTDPKLITEIISKIDRFKIYKDTLEVYGKKKSYQLANGKPDIRKIKKEAADKLIVEAVINQSEGSTSFPELMQEENRTFVRRIWETILDRIRGIYRKTNIDIFNKVAIKVIGENIGTITDIKSTGIYYQVTENTAVNKIFNIIEDFNKRLNLVDEDLINDIKRHYTLDGLGFIPSVTQLIKEGSKVPERTPLQQMLDSQKKDWGSEIHDYIYKFITTNLIDKDGYKRDVALEYNISTNLSPKVKERVEEFTKELINSYKDGTRFILEAKVINEKVKGNLASAIDFIALEPHKKEDGTDDVKVDVLDWKTTTIDKSREEDIHWAKQKDWKKQMGEYSKILYNYGVDPKQLRKARMIPFIINYKLKTVGEPKDGYAIPQSMEIGDLNVLNETRLYLLPVPLNSESTGNPKVDSLIKSLREQWEKLYKKSVPADERFTKIIAMNKLSEAIRNLHVKLNFEPLINIGGTFLENARTTIDSFNNIDYSTLSDTEIDVKLGELLEYTNSAAKFTNMDQIFLSEYKREGMTAENLKILKELEHISSMASRMLKSIAELQRQFVIQKGVRENITTENTKMSITQAEVVISGIAKTFLEGSKLSSKIIKLASNLIMNAKSLVNLKLSQRLKEYSKILIPLEEEAAKLGVSAFSLVGSMTPTGLHLIKKIDKKFWEEIKNAREKEDKAFFLKNINLEEYEKLAQETIDKGIIKLNKTVFSRDAETDAAQRSYKILKLKDSLLIKSDTFDGYNDYQFKRLFNQTMIEEGHYSKEYEQMKRSKAALDVWEFFVDLNKSAKEMGYLEKQGSSFFPLMEATILEKLSQSSSVIGQMKDSFVTDLYQTRINDTQNASRIDPETGQVKKQIPKYFIKTDKTVEQLSTDLNKIGAIWIKSLLEYESSKNLENTLLTLHSVEKAKGSLVLNENGDIIYEGGEPTINEAENKNADILETIIDDSLYRLDQDLNAIGNIGVAKLSSLRQNEEDKQAAVVNIKKALRNADTLTRSLGVGLKPLIALANWAGYQFQAFINSGTMYSFSEFEKNNFAVSTGISFSNEARALLDLIIPLNEDISLEERRKIALKQGLLKFMSTWSFTDVMMVTNSFPERKLQFANAMSINQNSMVVNGKIVNIRQFLKEQDRIAKYKLSVEERKTLEKSFEKRVKELQETSSLVKVLQIINEEAVIPGVSLEELSKYRTKVVEFGRLLNGQMNEDNKAGYRRDAIFTSFMMFKNWIPKLLSSRTGTIQKNIELGEWEYGRARVFFKTWQHLGFKNIAKMREILNGSEEGLAIMKEILELKRIDHFKKTGQTLEITEEEFYDLVREQLENQKKELILLLTSISLIISAKLSVPPDDDTATQEQINRYKWWLKGINKITDEVTFYYNPLSFEQMTKGSLLPSLNLMTKVERIFINLGLLGYGEFTDDEDMIKKAHPTKYFFNIVPGLSQIQSEILPYVYPELAKELGVRVTTQSRQ